MSPASRVRWGEPGIEVEELTDCLEEQVLLSEPFLPPDLRLMRVKVHVLEQLLEELWQDICASTDALLLTQLLLQHARFSRQVIEAKNELTLLEKQWEQTQHTDTI